MAAIGKIRSWGPWLVGIIALALFGFIATDLTKSCETTSNQKRQRVGEVLGKKLNYPEYDAMINQYEEVLKFLGYEVKDDARTELSDHVWQMYLENELISDECKKLGLEVTDAELASVFQNGTDPVLYQTRLMRNMQQPIILQQFFNQQTGRFDYSYVTMTKENLRQQAEKGNREAIEMYPQFNNYWSLVEKLVRQQLLTNKYQNLLKGCLISNPVSARMSFDAQNTESTVALASLSYASINDTTIAISDADLKAKYAELKPMFATDMELRDIKYVVCQVKPSAIDRAKLMDQMKEAAAELRADSLADYVVRNYNSDVNYIGLPLTEAALTKAGVKACVDTLAVGKTTNPFQLGNERAGYTLNVVKLYSKQLMPDSIEFRQILVGGKTPKETAQRADSILQALKAGAVFDTLAVKYGNPVKKNWFTAAAYENENSVNADARQLYKTIMEMNVNELRSVSLAQYTAILQVTDRRNFVNKYDVAIVKRPVDFSDSTAIDTYNTFSRFVSESKTIAELEANAPNYGYQVQSARVPNSVHYIANLRGTHNLLKWVFTEAKVGEISTPTDKASDEYNKSDYIVVAALEKVHPQGYLEQAAVEEQLRAEILKDKKFEQLAQQFNGVKTIADARAKGIRVDTVPYITFPAAVNLKDMGVRESALSGAIAGVAKGETSKNVVKGDNGAYLFEVVDRVQRQESSAFNAANTENQLSYQNLNSVFSTILQDLLRKANVVDNRYLFSN